MRLLSSPIIARIGWATGSLAVGQGLRLVNNVILARLLAPELFGIMLVINTLRIGVELLSDIGVGQNIISNRKGEEPDFYNTAWSLQAMRGVLLFLIALACTPLISTFYENPVFGAAVPVFAMIFVINGFRSIQPFLLQKRMDTRRQGLFEIFNGVLSIIVHVVLALIWPTIWALIGAMLLCATIQCGITYFLLRDVTFRPALHKDHVQDILHFGKWVFLSSIVYFLGMNFDRLFLAKAVTLTALGIYGVARSFSDIANLVVTRMGNAIIFPAVAASGKTRQAMVADIAPHRRNFMLAAAAALAGFAALADVIVMILYDHRYHAAGFILPLLVLGTWFSILSTVAESVLLGLGRPGWAAAGNTAKLGALAIGLPLAFGSFGLVGAIAVIALADLFRYLPLAIAQRAERVSFIRQDGLATLVFFALAFALRTLLIQLGLVGDWQEMWALGASLRG